MDIYFLDSSVIIECLRNNRKYTEAVGSLKGLVTSGYVVMSELYEAVFVSRKKTETKVGLENLFAGLDKIYGLDENVSRMFGEIRSFLRMKGMLIDDIDIFIASICRYYDLTLFTLNKKHFERIEGLKLADIEKLLN